MKNNLISVAVGIKSNSRILKIIGGIFFTLSLITGIFWICGAQVEPVAFVLGLIASFFFSIPSIAKYFVPNRKSIYQMSTPEIIEFIKTTDPKNDWKRISTNLTVEMYLLEDPKLRFRCHSDDMGTHSKDFKEPWANRHPDPNAYSYCSNLYYDSALIDQFILVSVDGCRAEMPLPRIRVGDEIYFSGISELQHHVGKIHDYQGLFDEYMGRCGLIISKTRKSE